MLLCVLVLAAVSPTHSVDINYYLNVRWDNVSSLAADPRHVPYNHGLRYVPALYVALNKIKAMNITPPRGFHGGETFYARKNAYMAGRIKGKNSRMKGKYFIGDCRGTPESNTCSNDDIFHLKKSSDLLGDADNIKFIFPNITGNQDELGVRQTLKGLTTAMSSMDLAGILGSTDAAQLAAVYALYYQVPNFVTHVTGGLGKFI